MQHLKQMMIVKGLVNAVLLLVVVFLLSCNSTKKSASVKGNIDTKELASDNQIRESTLLFFNANKEKLIGNLSAAENLYVQTIKLNPANDAALYDLAKIYDAKGKTKEALDLTKKATDISPENTWYLSQLAELYIKTNELDNAISVFKKLVKTRQDNYQYSFELASLYTYQKKYEDAIKIYEEVEKSTGVIEEISIEKLNIYMTQGKSDLAIEEINKLIKTDTSEIRFQGLLAETYDKLGKKEDAARVYQKMIDLDPDNGMLNLSLTEYYKQNNQPEKAFECMKKAFSSDQIDIDTKVGILLTYFQNNPADSSKNKEAYILLENLQTAHSTEAKAPAIYGDFLNRDGKFSQARDQFRKSIQLDKGRYLVWNQVMALNLQLTDFDALIMESTEAIDLFPTQPSFYFYKAIGLNQKKNYLESIEVLNIGKELVIEDKVLKAQFYASLGDAYHNTKNHEESDKSFKKAIEFDPLNPTVLNNFSYYLSLRGEKLEEAAQMSKLSNDLQANQASYQDTYAWILYMQSKYQDALVWIEKALSNGGSNDATVIEHYGDILFRLGQVDKALEQWKKAKEKGGASDFIDKKIIDKQIYE
jgi:tetratricopeptide (TPR) repeat protein